MKKQSVFKVCRLILLIMVAGLLGFVSVYRDYSLDFTLNQRNSLSPESRVIAAGMTQPIHILGFTREDQKSRMQNLLQRFKRCNNRISYTIYNPDRHPQLARDYHISSYGNLILVSRNQQIKIQQADEVSVSNGLLEIAETNQKKIAIILGQPEDNLQNRNDHALSLLKNELEHFNTIVELLPSRAFPDSIRQRDLIILCNPPSQSFPKMIPGILSVLEHDIPMMILLEPEQSPERDAWLSQYSVKISQVPILDEETGLLNPEPSIITCSHSNPNHPITARLSTSLFFPGTAAIRYDSLTAPIQPLVFSSEHSFLKTESDIRGPFCVAVSLSVSPSSANLLLIGDADFCTNAHLYNGANLEFFKTSVNFLLKRERLIAISTQKLENQSMILTPAQQKYLFLWVMIALPITLSITGFIYLKYRKGKSLSD